jgi:hypothetical protein
MNNERLFTAGVIFAVFALLGCGAYLIHLLEYEGKWPARGADCNQIEYKLVNGPCDVAGSPENMQATIESRAVYDRQKATMVSATATAGAPNFYLENDGIRIYGYVDPSTGASIYVCKDWTNDVVPCRVWEGE